MPIWAPAFQTIIFITHFTTMYFCKQITNMLNQSSSVFKKQKEQTDQMKNKQMSQRRVKNIRRQFPVLTIWADSLFGSSYFDTRKRWYSKIKPDLCLNKSLMLGEGAFREIGPAFFLVLGITVNTIRKTS